MREIKFRAWFPEGHWYMDNDETRMLYNFQNTTACEMFLFNDEDEGIILMQYTGLKDKNGKEIYEGDVVKVPEGYGGDFHFNECNGIIKYDAPEFFIDARSLKDYIWDGVEVIGNIYENKDLL